jgi:hypothetical protein
MYMRKPLFAMTCISILAGFSASGAEPPAKTDLDPEALRLLKTTTDLIAAAKNFSFRSVVSRDRLASNGQIVTYFTVQKVTVSRPDKIRVDIDGEHHDLQFFFDGTAATLYAPENKLYGQKNVASKDLDQMIAALDKDGLSFPTEDFLKASPYESLTKSLKTAYVIGRVNLAGKSAVHLVCTEPGADWQLWLSLDDKPLPQRLEVIYHREGSPRISVDFHDWNLEAAADPSLFTFEKPADAHQIHFEVEKEQ